MIVHLAGFTLHFLLSAVSIDVLAPCSVELSERLRSVRHSRRPSDVHFFIH